MGEDNLFSRFLEEIPVEESYPGAPALMEDLLRLTGLLCLAYSEINHNENTPYELRGVQVSEETFFSDLEARSVRAEPVEALPEAVRAVKQIRSRVEVSRRQGTTLPFAALVERFSLEGFESFCLLLAVSTDLDRRFERIFAFLQDDVNCTRATLGLAWDMFSLLEPVPEQTVYAMLDRQRPINELLLTDWQSNAGRSALARPLAVPKQLLYQLTGVELAGIDDLSGQVRVLRGMYEPVFWNEEKIDEGAAFIRAALSGASDGRTSVLCLFGRSGRGKSFALSQMARRLQVTLLEVQGETLLRQDISEILLRRIAIRCLLEGQIPCLDRLEMERPETRSLVRRAVRVLGRYFPLLILCADAPMEEGAQTQQLNLEFTMPNAAQRYALWEHFTSRADAPHSEGVLTALAGRYCLTPMEISSLASLLARNTGDMAEERDIFRAVSKALRQQACSRLGDLAQYVSSPFGWGDLQLPEETTQMLRSACSRVKCRYQVNENWGFSRKLPYGQGLSVLLYGPPGTGKSMMAQVLANEVGMDLFRVDLSQIVDKYVGETEKNLRRLFDTAEGVNCILFFDEADALFSRRTEVSDSKDKYANMETAYLLQRIEQYSGVTVLATNNARNFDEAFRRRMTYYINIPMPDKQARQRIWESVFPAEIPIDRNVSFEELAEKFEFSGSSIKSVAVSAAYSAAAAGTAVTRDSIFEALSIEHMKTGKMLQITDYPH